MKKSLLAGLLSVGLCFQLVAQNIDKLIGVQEAEDHLKYLSSDEMMGRDTGSPEIEIAAEYMVETFKNYGVKPLPNQSGFYQEVDLLKTNIPDKGELNFMDSTLIHGQNILILRGLDTTATLKAVFGGFALEEDLDSIDITGKIVIAKFGYPEMTNVRDGFKTSRTKRKIISDKGGLGLIELYNSAQINWSYLTLYLNRSSMILDDHANSMVKTPYHMFINDVNDAYLSNISHKGISKVNLKVSGLTPERIKAKNVIGYIEGSDKILKEEFLVLSAHYDHVGHTKASMKDGEPVDSIFNGARDNALGVTGLLMAAKYFGIETPKRSILFIGFTAEEKGLLGSEYYGENPWVPLNQCIFDINIDCAGYNDKTKATIFGMSRSTAEESFKSACAAYGLEAIDDPIPEQNIFERSDQLNFANKGVPAVLFGPGVTSFDQEIQKYYHQVVDEAESLDFIYLNKVFKAFIKASEDIANAEEAPVWKKGDKYESAGKALYGLN